MVHGEQFYIDNTQWRPAGGQWGSSSDKSPHGRILKQLIRDGSVNSIDKPVDIWHKFPDLRVVNPYNKGNNFRTFVNRCREAVKKEDDIDDVVEDNMSDDDDDSSYEEDPRTKPKNQGRRGASRRGDAPSGPQGPRNPPPPLTTGNPPPRNQQVQSENHVVTIGNSVFLLLLPSGSVQPEDLVAQRYEGTRKNLVKISHPGTITQDWIHHNFPWAQHNATVKALLDHLVLVNDGVSAENDERVPQSPFQIFDMGHDVEASPSSWILYRDDGTPVHLSGRDVIGGVVVYHYLKLDANTGTVHRSPTRPRPAPRFNTGQFQGAAGWAAPVNGYGQNFQQYQPYGAAPAPQYGWQPAPASFNPQQQAPPHQQMPPQQQQAPSQQYVPQQQQAPAPPQQQYVPQQQQAPAPPQQQYVPQQQQAPAPAPPQQQYVPPQHQAPRPQQQQQQAPPPPQQQQQQQQTPPPQQPHVDFQHQPRPDIHQSNQGQGVHQEDGGVPREVPGGGANGGVGLDDFSFASMSLGTDGL